jgi:hypothetical protein
MRDSPYSAVARRWLVLHRDEVSRQSSLLRICIRAGANQVTSANQICDRLLRPIILFRKRAVRLTGHCVSEYHPSAERVMSIEIDRPYGSWSIRNATFPRASARVGH